MEIENGDILLCQVEKIEGTTVFVNINNSKKTGTIILSEVSPGRIRNLRDYVVPKKTIVCKVLRVMDNHIELSLRRVTQKEKKEVMGKHKIEKSYKSILKSILKEKTKDIISKITEKNTLYDFLEESKQNPKELEKLIGKKEAKDVLEILNNQKKKIIQLKKEIQFYSSEPNGLDIIKETLGNFNQISIKYIAAGKYTLSAQAENIKEADKKIEEIIEKIEKKIKSKNIEFSHK